MTRTTSRIAAFTSAALIIGALSTAHAEDAPGLEIGGFVGYHVFNDNNELGQVDVPDADSPDSTVAFGLRVGYGIIKMSKLLLGVEGEFALMPTTTRRTGASVFPLVWRGQAYATYDTGGRIRPFAVLGFGASTSTSSSDTRAIENDTDFVWHGGVGAKLALTGDFGVRIDGRILFPPSSASEFVTTDLELLVGFYKTFGHTPAKQAPQPEPVPHAAAPTDSDGDGLTDDEDKCPNEPEDMDQFEDEDGCPDADNDKDGIPDTRDTCPNDPETKNGVDDEDGCPETDTDGDGLVGSADKCPERPEDKDGFEDTDGCPDPDNDKDGVLDPNDKCPAKPETMNGFEDEDGCPDVLPKKIKRFTGVIKGIRFRTGSAKLRASSFRVLRKAVKLLEEFPALRLTISGHTDNRGARAMNVTLSQKRADSVKAYLVKKGVAADRIVAKGIGPDKPIASNKRWAGRARNRRVEFAPITGAQK